MDNREVRGIIGDNVGLYYSGGFRESREKCLEIGDKMGTLFTGEFRYRFRSIGTIGMEYFGRGGETSVIELKK